MSTKVNMTGTIKPQITQLRVWNRPSLSGAITSIINNAAGKVIFITEIEGNWGYSPTTGGWSYISELSLKSNDNKTTVQINKSDQEILTTEANNENNKNALAKQLDIIEENFSTTTMSDNEISDSLLIHNLNGVYGIPYQFMASVDPRLKRINNQETVIGRKYAEKIVTKIPLLCITPGKVEFMSNYSKIEKKGLVAALDDIKRNGPETDISNIISNNGRYYTFAFDYAGYFDYVNALCRIGAKFLNIHDVELDIGGKHDKAANFDWANALNKNLKASFTSQEFIGFYIDSEDSISESFSNGTTQSQLANTLNGFSDTARELSFLLGAGAGQQYQLMDESKLNETLDTIDGISKQYLNGNTLFKTIAGNFATIAVGGKLLFPEIWADSEFSRDVGVTIKLRTPDSDTMSWYINIFVPLCHLIALAAGHQTDNPNGYYSPFLIRAWYKGLFNVDMGIVTSMNIRKGKEAAWNVDGLPTEIDVDLSIKDLYNMLSIVPGNEPKNFVTNNILMDYIANSCGININQLDIQRSLEIYYILSVDRVLDLPNRVGRKFEDAINNYGMNLYNGVLNNFLI